MRRTDGSWCSGAGVFFKQLREKAGRKAFGKINLDSLEYRAARRRLAPMDWSDRAARHGRVHGVAG